jgi:uncharacterized OB-fold protein
MSPGASPDAAAPPFAAEPGAPPHSIREFTHAYEEEGRLLGYACRSCGFLTLTYLLVCPRCGTPHSLEDRPFAGKGHVLSYTLQHVPSDEFVNDAPYAYALIELEEGVRTSGWLPGVKRPEDLAIGDAVQWTRSYRTGLVFEKVPVPRQDPPERRSGP